MHRKTLLINNLNISFLDNEKEGKPFICLHGNFGTASNLAFIEKYYSGRVIIPDLRGHGLSEHAAEYNIPEYLKDLEILISLLKVDKPIIFGHSLGGIIAMVYESKHQNLPMLIIEDIGTEINESNEFIKKFPKEFSSVDEVDKTFKNVLGRPLSTYFMESLFYNQTY